MSLTTEFKKALARELDGLNEDEWALAKEEEALLAKVAPHEAFSEIAEILQLATEQDDPYGFSRCCWFSLALARKSDTSEFPAAATDLIPDLEARAASLEEHCPQELSTVFAWFRLPPRSNNEVQQD